MATGLLRDTRFRDHAAPYPHPERPERLAAIETRIEAEGLADRCRRVEARHATDEELLAVHTPELLREVADTADRPFTSLDPDTYASSASAEAARLVSQLLPGSHIEVAEAMTAEDEMEASFRGVISIENARAQLGWSPRYPVLREGIQQYIDAYREYLAAHPPGTVS